MFHPAEPAPSAKSSTLVGRSMGRLEARLARAESAFGRRRLPANARPPLSANAVRARSPHHSGGAPAAGSPLLAPPSAPRGSPVDARLRQWCPFDFASVFPVSKANRAQSLDALRSFRSSAQL